MKKYVILFECQDYNVNEEMITSYCSLAADKAYDSLAEAKKAMVKIADQDEQEYNLSFNNKTKSYRSFEKNKTILKLFIYYGDRLDADPKEVAPNTLNYYEIREIEC